MDSHIPTLLAAVLVTRLYLGGFLLVSALGKLANLSSFIDGTVAYRILPPHIAKPFALLLPWIELGTAALLLSGSYLWLAGLMTVFLLLCFIFAVTINLQRGREVPCSCYGLASTELISWGTVARNLFLLALASIILFAGVAEPGATRWMLEEGFFFSYSTIILVVILLACCYLSTRLLEAAVQVHMVGRKVAR